MKYLLLVDIYERLEATSKRLAKTYYISELLKETVHSDIKKITLLLQGKIFPDWDERKLGISSRLVIKAINVSAGVTTAEVENEWRETGDLGLVAENLTKKKRQSTLFSQELSADKVFNNLKRLPDIEGQGAVDRKIRLITELLSGAKPKEAKYLVRTVLGDMRVGIGTGTLRDAIAWAYLKPKIRYLEKEQQIEVEDREEYKKLIDLVQSAYNKSNDFSIVAEAAKKGEKALANVSLIVGNPIQVMLAQKVADLEEGFEKVGSPAELEFKLDGFRMQIHKSHGKISIFTRRLEEVTKQFPEVVEAVKKHVSGKNFILDSEAVGFDAQTNKYKPFQHISQRIRRKYDIELTAKKLPVELNVFDVLAYEGKNLLNTPLEKRRKILEKILKPKKRSIVLAESLITKSKELGKLFYQKSLNAGNEGIMLKNLNSVYKPGSRVGFVVKLKPVMETLDLVIVGAEWGNGKRSGWLTSYTAACQGDDELLEIGKVGTGIKELKGEDAATFEDLTEALKPLIVSEKGKEVRVKPEVVIEVNYEEIQKSPTYSSGFALRFPRLVKLRPDRGAKDISTIDMVKELHDKQKKS